MYEVDLFDDLKDIAPIRYQGSNNVKYFLKYFLTTLPTTYFNDGEIQCNEKCDRGFYDIYYVTKANFPGVTMDEVAKCLIELCEKGHTITVKFSKDVDKLVFGNIDSTNILKLPNASKFEFSRRVGVDNLCLLDILCLAEKPIDYV